MASKTVLPPFQAVLDAYHDRLWRYLVVAVGPNDAGDVHQETLLAALRAYPQLEDDRNIWGWLVTIAHRKSIDIWRRQRRALPTDPVELPELAEVIPDVDDGLWQRVAELPDKQRAAVLHRYVGDLAYRDIAVLLDCSEAAARQNVSTAVRKLREDLRTGGTSV